ncbi:MULTISPECIES: transcription repressor NadR [Virgibacillus]|uniref:Transcriptional regulator n=2 Tax=Virgibacillus TaxID=84406 RepID=A0ABQ2DRB7_9BACI|nr:MULTISPECIES: 3H domain-containing protein [Virgibacillus]EQB38964.1 hypothetical protein M948_01045 [Virgibacillus sp. CM-4]MYL43325.1 HTH domain-containing protein [Virgibacillus massiliensis]GGJ67555.1 transcriptional regulator [Virgibacillus kapii]CDQ41088.1 putative transcription repressor NiaR [Virgibacillus massiliensis]
MSGKQKLLGEERRKAILDLLRKEDKPIKGGQLAELTNVSRQVIVNDITLLKAKNEPIMATSQGYLYISHSAPAGAERIVACQHPPMRTEEELNLLVDHGLTVKDVTIEHSVYGDLTASIMVANRVEVANFIEKITSTGASYLSELTEGVHLHTLVGVNENQLDKAEEALKKAGFLIQTNE